MRVARCGGEVVGGLSLPVAGQYFGGRVVPVGALRAVAVTPHRRGSGVGGALVRGVLAELYERGVPLAVLFPATQPIYRRQGFEQAGTWTVYRLPTQAIDVRDRSMEVERVAPQDLDWAAIKDLYDRVAVGSAGLLDRNDWFWRRRFWIGTKELPAYVYTVSNEHGLQGYVSFTHRAGDRRFDLVVHDLIAATSAASRRLWSLLADHRSMAEHVEWAGPPSESLLLGLAEMEAEVVRRMHWMLRLVDVPAALESRGYLPGITGELHFAVSDGIIAANHGNWTMRVGNGVAKVSPGGRGEVALDVRGLAALYTGFMSPFQLRRAGLIEGNDHQLAVAAALFAGPAPWMVDFF